MKIVIDPEFRDLIPPLAPQELEQLHKSIVASGCRDSLIVWKEEKILVDGHNRYAFCTEHGIEMNFIERRFTSRQSVKNFIILNQLGRRNVTPETASMLRAEYHASMSKGVGGNRGNQHTLPNLENQGLAEPSKTTAAIVAEQTGVSESTVEADVRLMKALDKLGIPRADYAAGKVRDAKGKKRSKASILTEAFPPKRKPEASSTPAPVEPDESEAAEDDEPEPLVVDGTKEPGVAMVYARTALDALNKIPAKDPMRSSAIEAVAEWVSVAESKPTTKERTTKWVPDDAERLWLLAKVELDKILPTDPSRERVLREVIDYCNDRISNKK
jgi:hypothetical protein